MKTTRISFTLDLLFFIYKIIEIGFFNPKYKFILEKIKLYIKYKSQQITVC